MVTHCTDEKVRILCECAGLPYKMMCGYAGITPRTYRNWRVWARDGKEPYASAMAKIEAAEANRLLRLTQLIEDIGAGERDPETGEWTRRPNWQALAWMIERRYPEYYGMVPQLRQEVQESEGRTSLEARQAALREAYARTRPGAE